MVYVLTTIETQINNILNAKESGNRKSILLNKCSDVIKNEVCQARICFRKMLLEERDDSYLQRFYRVHEAALINLIERLENATTNRTPGHIATSTAHLTALLQYLHEEFRKYFDDSLVAPTCWAKVVVDDVKHQLAGIRERPANDLTDKSLWDIALKPIEQFINKKGQHYTFRQIQYIQFLQSVLIQFTPTVQDVTLARQDLVNLLIRINYNTPDFFQFCCKHIASTLTVTETLSDRIDQVSYFFKTVSQVEVLPRLALIVAERQIKVQLLDWLASELEHLRQKQLLQLSCPSKDETIRNDFKVNFDLSVSHLAYLFKVFTDTGVVQNKNTSELIRFLAKFVKTKKAESVSYESFRIKFYNTESGTKDAVRKTLQSLLSYMNKN